MQKFRCPICHRIWSLEAVPITMPVDIQSFFDYPHNDDDQFCRDSEEYQPRICEDCRKKLGKRIVML